MINNSAVKSGIIFYLFFFLFSCATLPPAEDMKTEVESFQLPKLPDDGKAVVYVVRPSTFGQEFRFSVFIDNQESKSYLGYTMGNQYIYFSLAPGEHKIFSKADHWAEINVSAKPGDIMFIRQEPSMGMVTFNNELQTLQDYEGKYLVKTLGVGTFSDINPPAAATLRAKELQEQSLSGNSLGGIYKGVPVEEDQTPSSKAAAQAAAPPAGQSAAPGHQQTGTVPSGKVLIYIYRLPGKTGFGAFSDGDSPVPFGIKANGKTLLTLERGFYYAYLTEPGYIEFTTFEVGFMAPNTVYEKTFEAKDQQTYYIKGSHGKGAFGKPKLEFVTPEEGAADMANCKAVKQ